MSVKNRTTLKTYFESGDKPTQAQFEHLIDSFLHLTEDSAKVGLTIFDSTVSYKAGRLVVYQGQIYQFVEDHQGAWDASHAEPFDAAPRYGIQDYDNSTQFTTGDYATYKLKVYRCIQDVQGVAPDDSNGSTYWTQVPIVRPDVITDYSSGTMYYKGDQVQKDGGIYELTPDNLSTDYKESTDFEAELGNTTWTLIAGKRKVQKTGGSPVTVETGTEDYNNVMVWEIGDTWAKKVVVPLAIDKNDKRTLSVNLEDEEFKNNTYEIVIS